MTGPDATAALLRAAHATTRQQVIHHLLDAVSAGLHAPDAMKALAEWDATHTVPARFREDYDPSPDPIERRIS